MPDNQISARFTACKRKLFDTYFSKLNDKQREAVYQVNGPLLILAGAGSGKTSTMTERIAYMIDQGISPYNILAVTFTNKAAKEMKERLQRLIDPVQARKVTLGTFHSFCGRILRKHISLAGNYNSSFTIADESDQKSIIRQAAAELGYSKDELPTDVAASFISNWKNKLWWPADAKEDAMLNDVRVCGFRKPGLDLPQHQKRLDKYIAQFNALVEQYKNEE